MSRLLLRPALGFDPNESRLEVQTPLVSVAQLGASEQVLLGCEPAVAHTVLHCWLPLQRTHADG